MGGVDGQAETLEPAGHVFQTDLPVPVSGRIGKLQQQRGNGDQPPVPHPEKQGRVLSPPYGFSRKLTVRFQRRGGPEYGNNSPGDDQQDQDGKQ